MKKKKISAKEELDLLTGLIVSDRFIKEIYKILDLKLLKIPHIKKLTKWCIDYYKKYEKAPGQTIQDIFTANKKQLEEEEAELIEMFLANLSEKYEEDYADFNESYILDQSEKYLAQRKLTLLTESVDGYTALGDIEQAELAVVKHMRVERQTITPIDVFKDEQAMLDAINEESDIIFQLPGAIGEMVGPFEKTDFFSFIAPGKRGKTFALEDMVVKMVNRQLKVVLFCFEMPKNQMLRRIGQNYCGQTRWAKTIQFPYFEEEEINNKMVRNGNILYRKVNKTGLHGADTIAKLRSLKMTIKTGQFKLLCPPANTMNVQDIYESVLSMAHYDGFYPDAIVIDYADILAKEHQSGKDKLHQIDDTWLALRALAQKIKGVVVTATQSSKASFSKDITEGEIAQNIRKQNHVTHMQALNQTPEEKKQLIIRNSMLAIRNQEFHIDDEVISLCNFALANFCLSSEWKKNVNL